MDPADETPAKLSSCTRCRRTIHLRIYFPRRRNLFFRRKNWIARFSFTRFDRFETRCRSFAAALGPELAEFQYTRQIFKLNFLGNGRSREKTSFFLFDLFLRVEWRAEWRRAAQRLRVSRPQSNTFACVNRIARNNSERVKGQRCVNASFFLCSIRLIANRSVFLSAIVSSKSFARITRIRRAKYRSL